MTTTKTTPRSREFKRTTIKDKAMPFINDIDDIMDTKTIDRARGIVLRYIPPPLPDVASSFLLEWNDHKIHFHHGRETETIRDDQGYKFNITHEVHYIALPEGFDETEKTIFQVITDALNAFGDFYDREQVNKVTVNFTADVFTPPRFGIYGL